MPRPTLSYLKNLALVLFGLPLGLLTGLTAIGSSVFAVPLVRSLLGLRPARAVGTALVATFFAALASVLSYQQHGDIRWKMAFGLAVGQVVGAAWGERLMQSVPALARLRILWAILVAAGGLAMIAVGLGIWHQANLLSFLPPLRWLWIARWFWIAVVAVFVGFASRVIGLGGVLQVPVAIFLLGLSPQSAQGTALIVLLLASLPGALIHAQRGEVEPQAATWLSAGAVFGGLVGARYAVDLSPDSLLTIFGVVFALLGLWMLWARDGSAAPPPSEA